MMADADADAESASDASAEATERADRAYEVIAAFAGGLVAHGVRDVVISPGSRSTPLAVTLHAHPELRTWIQIDERSAGFFALGQAKVTGRPSVLVCTSGTAAANYLPAVVEAHHSGVPVIVCTADRPPELRGWGAGQTIDQVGIYGSATRWAVDLPVAGEPGGFTPRQARMVAHRAVDAAGAGAGPVHLNWPLREPLEPRGPVPVAPPAGPPGAAFAPVLQVSPAVPGSIGGSVPVSAERGVIVVGPDTAVGIAAQHAVVDAALRLSARTGWPVVGEPISGARRQTGRPAGGRQHAGLASEAVCVANAGHLLRLDEVARELRPELVIRVGGSPTTKPVKQWLARHEAPLVLIDPARRWNDASFTTTWHLDADPVMALDSFPARDLAPRGGPASGWRERWAALDRAASAAITAELERGRFLSAGVVRALTGEVPPGTLVMTSNSMPVRDLDTFVASEGPPIGFVGNRGASGIDGITSTALGLASRHDGPVVLLTGDLALLHDLGALFGAARTGLHLTIVCIDNDGGGIFSMLPIAEQGTAIDFETLFRTPHGLDLSGFGGIGGVRAAHITTEEGLVTALDRALRDAVPGVDLLVVPVDRDADLAQRSGVGAAVAAAVAALVPSP